MVRNLQRPARRGRRRRWGGATTSARSASSATRCSRAAPSSTRWTSRCGSSTSATPSRSRAPSSSGAGPDHRGRGRAAGRRTRVPASIATPRPSGPCSTSWSRAECPSRRRREATPWCSSSTSRSSTGRCPHSNPRSRALSEALCRDVVERGAASVPGSARQVRILVTQQLRSGAPMAGVAGELGVSERTLRRRLDAEGTAYQRLVDEVRESLAVELLGDRAAVGRGGRAAAGLCRGVAVHRRVPALDRDGRRATAPRRTAATRPSPQG